MDIADAEPDAISLSPCKATVPVLLDVMHVAFWVIVLMKLHWTTSWPPETDNGQKNPPHDMPTEPAELELAVDEPPELFMIHWL